VTEYYYYYWHATFDETERLLFASSPEAVERTRDIAEEKIELLGRRRRKN